MPRPTFLTQKFHDTPPKFNSAERQRHLYVDSAFEENVLSKIRGSSNKAYISLAYCYFKVSFQFFDSAYAKDLQYLANRFSVQQGDLHWDKYQRNTKKNHQALILDFVGFRSFDDKKAQNSIHSFVKHNARVQKNFKSCFYDIAVKLRQEKIEIPSYQKLQNLISSSYLNHENKLLNIVDSNLTNEDKALLDEMFSKDVKDGNRAFQYRLTLLKRFSHALKPSKIAGNIAAFDNLHQLFLIAEPIMEKLNLNDNGIRHYATAVRKQQVFQVKRRKDNDRHLYLLAFITHQFYLLQDILVDTFISSVTTAYNVARRKAKEHYYKLRNEQSKNTGTLVNQTEYMLETVECVKAILRDKSLNDSIKIERALHLLSPDKKSAEVFSEVIDKVKTDLDSMSGEALLYHFLEEGSLKLQRRCNEIIKRLEFNTQLSNKSLTSAINRFKDKDGAVDGKYPAGFMSPPEKRYIDTKETFKSKLYKVSLFNHIKDALKGDALSLAHSYRYKNIDLYLISSSIWEKDRLKLLGLADMEGYQNFKEAREKLGLDLHKQYQETNHRVVQNTNNYIKTDGLGGFRTQSARNTSFEQILLDSNDIQLYPKKNFVSVSEVLNTVNQASGFLNEFQHHDNKYLKTRPENKVLIAAIRALGCHFSPTQFAKLSKSIDGTDLVTTVNKYVSIDNARLACNSISKFVTKMPLANLFVEEYGLQTSSDGQKWTVAKDSNNANYSFKYGGKDLVLSAYSFIDCRNLFTHSEVISGSDREAHYMLDGVLRNDVVKSDLHSTDTHGYTEMVFGASHLLNISFAPRIKNVHKQHLYSLKDKRIYSNLKYPILPKKKINLKIIETHWDEILRLVASIKLGETTASQVFKRLNSYSRDNNSLYLALKEFGRIIKSHYILRFIDDPELRGAVQKQLNKGESGNKLDRALAIGRSDYVQVEKGDQEIVESCKRVLKNAIVCWNYMYLSKKLLATKDKAKKQALINKIMSSSTVTWGHFLIHGEFDFSDSTLEDSHSFVFDKMHDPRVLKL